MASQAADSHQQGRRNPTLRKSILWVSLYTAIAFTLLILNPQRLYSAYGSGNGRYQDLTDSWSEYLVRNTVTLNVLDPSRQSLLPIHTSGYDAGDYTFHPTDFGQYTSNLVGQTMPLTTIARVVGIDSQSQLETLFTLARLGQALAFSLFLTTFLFCFCQRQRLRSHFIIPLLIGASAGFVLFSQNLYWLTALLIAPAAYIALFSSRKRGWSKALVLILSVIYFLRGYEFATVFALLTGFSAMLFAEPTWRRRLAEGATAFGMVVLAFPIALGIHTYVVSVASTNSVTWKESLSLIFDRVRARNLSLEEVPAPLSLGFFRTIGGRMVDSAFGIMSGLPTIVEVVSLLALIAAGLRLILLYRKTRCAPQVEVIVVCYGLVGYASWYFVAYQHILAHGILEPFLFAFTVGLSVSMLLLIYLDRALRRYLPRPLPASL